MACCGVRVTLSKDICWRRKWGSWKNIPCAVGGGYVKENEMGIFEMSSGPNIIWMGGVSKDIKMLQGGRR